MAEAQAALARLPLAVSSTPAFGSRLFGPYRIAYSVLLILIMGMIALGMAVAPRPLAILENSYGDLEKNVLFIAPACLWIAFISFRLLRNGQQRPAVALRRLVWRERFWLARTAVFFALVEPGMAAFSALKDAIPSFVPFYADPWLVSADRALFGTDAWRLTHAVIGPFGTMVLDRLYIVYFVVLVVMTVWLCTTRDARFQVRGLLTLVGTWLFLGVVMATATASVGPIYYHHFFGNRTFDPLIARLTQTDAMHHLTALDISKWLLESGHGIGAGISAMPSLHVGKAWFAFILVQDRFGWRWYTSAMLAFPMLMLVASVHLGWHYAVDGIVSMVLVSLLWLLFGKLVDATGETMKA